MIDEQLVDRHGEQFRHAQRQREARVVFVGLDGVDRLARDSEPAGELALAPAVRLAAVLDPILHALNVCKEFLTVKSSLQGKFSGGRRGFASPYRPCYGSVTNRGENKCAH